MLADHTKWNVTGLSSIAPLDAGRDADHRHRHPAVGASRCSSEHIGHVVAADPLFNDNDETMTELQEEGVVATVTFTKATRIYPGIDASGGRRISTCDIDDGEFLVLVGPSGCGKSTTLRMLAGLEPIDDGNVLIGDTDVTMLPPRDRDIAMVFQSYALYPHMTVAENIGFHLKIKKMPKAEIDRTRARGGARCSISTTTSIASRRSCRAANASASPWAGPSCASRRCS